jgi:hypothetical protein
MVDTHNQRQEMIEITSAELGLKTRRAASLGCGSTQSEKYAIGPRLGESLDLTRPSEPAKCFTSGKTFRSFRSLAPPTVPDRVGLASAAALHGYVRAPFRAWNCPDWVTD